MTWADAKVNHRVECFIDKSVGMTSLNPPPQNKIWRVRPHCWALIYFPFLPRLHSVHLPDLVFLWTGSCISSPGGSIIVDRAISIRTVLTTREKPGATLFVLRNNTHTHTHRSHPSHPLCGVRAYLKSRRFTLRLTIRPVADVLTHSAVHGGLLYEIGTRSLRCTYATPPYSVRFPPLLKKSFLPHIYRPIYWPTI